LSSGGALISNRILTENVRGFPQPLQTNAGISTSIGSRALSFQAASNQSLYHSTLLHKLAILALSENEGVSEKVREASERASNNQPSESKLYVHPGSTRHEEVFKFC
jgi:hypothetical protein